MGSLEGTSASAHLLETDSSSGAAGQPSHQSGTRELYWILFRLYLSHFLTRWGNRMWEFAVPLFLVTVWPDSLLLCAVYGLVEGGAVVAFGVPVGRWVDKTSRLKVVQLSLAVTNTSILAAALAVLGLLWQPSLQPAGFPAFVGLVGCVNFFGGLSRLGEVASDIVVERDWVVVIAEQHGLELLSEINSVMRRIDLSCKLLAPVAAGCIMSSVSVIAAAIVIAAWNILTAGLQYHLLASVYWLVPALQVKHSSPPKKEPDLLQPYEQLAGQPEEAGTAEEGQAGRNSWSEAMGTQLSQFFMLEGWSIYLKQDSVLAAVALALLYFTVLSLGSLMTANLQLQGVPPYILGLARGLAAVVGIAATFAYPVVHAQLGTTRTGLWASWMQWSLLSLSFWSIWITSPRLSSSLLVGGIVASRLGLWMFDLAVTQTMQESVLEHNRGVVNSTQSSLQSFMDMLMYIVAIVVSKPEDFWVAISMSYGAVTIAVLLYATHSYKVRGHLFHFDRFPCNLCCKEHEIPKL